MTARHTPSLAANTAPDAAVHAPTQVAAVAPLDPRILEQAAELLTGMHGPGGSAAKRAAELAAVERWRAQSAEHERAWARAQRLLRTLGQLPPELAMPVLDRPRATSRRSALHKFALLLAAGPAAWAGWRGWQWADGPNGPQLGADLRTVTGERREVALADGSRITLNTASAVDLRFDATQRLIHLRAGEILVQSHPDLPREPGSSPRPLRVRSQHGLMEALGTRFTVRQDTEATQVAVLEGAVRIWPGGRASRSVDAAVLSAGQQARFTVAHMDRALPADESVAAWRQGMLLADRMRLGDLAAELERYRGGWVHCDPAVAGLRVSGAYPVGSPADTDRALVMLVSTYPVEAHQRLRGHWVTFVPR